MFAPLTVLLAASIARVPQDETPAYRPWIVEEVVSVLRETTSGGRETLATLESELLPEARKAKSADEELRVAHRLLSAIPSSHVALFSKHAHDVFDHELLGEDAATLGFTLRRHDEGYAVVDVMAGGPASVADLRCGDRVLAIDGVAVSESPRLGLRTDDAHLPDRASHWVLGETSESVRFTILRGSESLEVAVVVAPYSSLRGDRAGARVIEVDEQRIGYGRLTYMYRRDTSKLMRPWLETTFLDCDGLVLDLRGRGGSQIAMWAVMAMFKDDKSVWTKPVVVLVDRETRSAKELLAKWFQDKRRGKVVGERTAGATRGGTLHPIGEEYFLMCPAEPFADPEGLELVGLEPDVVVACTWPNATGGDAILERGIEVLLAE